MQHWNHSTPQFTIAPLFLCECGDCWWYRWCWLKLRMRKHIHFGFCRNFYIFISIYLPHSNESFISAFSFPKSPVWIYWSCVYINFSLASMKHILKEKFPFDRCFKSLACWCAVRIRLSDTFSDEFIIINEMAFFLFMSTSNKICGKDFPKLKLWKTFCCASVLFPFYNSKNCKREIYMLYRENEKKCAIEKYTVVGTVLMMTIPS